MRAVVRHTTQYHLTAMSKKVKDLRLKYYWILLDYDGAISHSLHRQCIVIRNSRIDYRRSTDRLFFASFFQSSA